MQSNHYAYEKGAEVHCNLAQPKDPSFPYQRRIIMSKSHDTKKEGKKPATKTAKEKHDAKKAKKIEQAHREF